MKGGVYRILTLKEHFPNMRQVEKASPERKVEKEMPKKSKGRKM